MMERQQALAELPLAPGIGAEEVLESRILLVEDDMLTRTILAKLLRVEGFTHILEAENGEEGLEKVRSFRPDLIIADIKMPKMDGFEMCRAIRHDPDPAISRTPILVQTALKQMKDKARIFEMGATDYVTKPIDPAEITARCIVHLEREIIIRRLRKVNEQLARERSPTLPALPEEKEAEFWSFKRLSSTVNALLDEIERGHAELTHAMQRMGEADAMKIEFLSNVTRELKIPIQGIIESAQLGAADCDRGKLAGVKRHVGDVFTYGQRLEVLVGDLLDFSQLETGDIALALAPHSVAALIERANAFLRRQTEARRLSVRLEQPADAVYVRVDAARMEQVLITLLHNAIRFSPPAGGITWRVIPGAMDVSPTHGVSLPAVRILIEDEGPGLAHYKMEELFDPFVQGHGILQGVGLGLAIARRLLRTFHGTISASNNDKGGARFEIMLPLADDV